MAGVNRPQRSGTDWSRYTPFSNNEQINTSVAGTYETAYSVTGQGYLSEALFAATSGAGDIRITIDGSVVFEGGSISNTDIVGIVSSKSVQGTTPAVFLYNYSGVGALNGTVAEYPYTTGADEVCVILHEPIFFTTSLLIEVKEDSGGNINIRYSGGYIA